LSAAKNPTNDPVKAGSAAPYTFDFASGVTDAAFWVTVWLTVPLLAFHVVPPAVAPLYSAVMVYGLPATVSVDVVHVAWLDGFSATALHSVVAPILNVTVPFAPGSPAAAVTVAVNVAFAPYVVGLLLVTVVVVFREPPVTVRLVVPELVEWLGSPP